MKISKKCITLLCALILCFLSGGDALAAQKSDFLTGRSAGDITIMWDNTTLIDMNLSFDGSKAICGILVLGKPNTSQITATVTLDRKNSNGTYTTEKTWTGLFAADDMLLFDKVYYVSKGYTYRLSITATVFRYGFGEIVTASYENYCPN